MLREMVDRDRVGWMDPCAIYHGWERASVTPSGFRGSARMFLSKSWKHKL